MGRKRRQMEIEGTEKFYDEELSQAADALYEVRTQRIKLQEQEGEASARLIDVMKEKGVEVYEDDDIQIRATLKKGKDKVSLKRIKSEAGEDEDEFEDAAE